MSLIHKVWWNHFLQQLVHTNEQYVELFNYVLTKHLSQSGLKISEVLISFQEQITTRMGLICGAKLKNKKYKLLISFQETVENSKQIQLSYDGAYHFPRDLLVWCWILSYRYGCFWSYISELSVPVQETNRGSESTFPGVKTTRQDKIYFGLTGHNVKNTQAQIFEVHHCTGVT